MTLDKLRQVIRECAVSGSGGAGFPTYAKLDKRADTIILNCAECEPLLKLHRQVLEKYAYEIMSALTVISDAVEADSIIIAVKGSYRAAIDAVEKYLDSFPKVKVGTLPEIYPAGDEVVTIYETTKRVVPPGNIPISVGVTVFNVETILNVYNATNENEPVTEKFITVTGEVENPITVKVPLGITLGEVIRLAGGAKITDYALINGGPMTGNLCGENDIVTKTTNAVLVMPQDHYIIQKRKSKASINMKRAMAACCQCRMCTDLCSRNLLGHPIDPSEFMRVATSGDTRDIKPFINTFFCSGCGICEMYACMQNLSPRTLIAEYKTGLRNAGVAIPKDIEATEITAKRSYKKVPMSRLISRLGLAKYNHPAPLSEEKYVPKEVKIMLSQHIGTPAVPIVKKGDSVIRGQLIGNFSDAALGVGVHASISGKVLDVTEKYILIRK